ncbi:hypothetical protein L9F63_015639 [Diploptera punctata]|uniref:Uncharacterized protein n=1 Tax=Diploptera punctata TaxID=6984 RepID=A0AAD8A5T1_DIPPU|nr:hypothetical protein L9F63_015639 [Diploptera punctata]
MDDTNELETLMLSVANRRKKYPRQCAKILYDTMKTQLNALQSLTVESDDVSLCNSALETDSDTCRQKMNKALNATNLDDFVNKAERISERINNLERIKEEIAKSSKSNVEITIKKSTEILTKLTIWEKTYIQKNKFRSMNFEIPDERDLISKFIKSTPDGNIIHGDSNENPLVIMSVENERDPSLEN